MGCFNSKVDNTVPSPSLEGSDLKNAPVGIDPAIEGVDEPREKPGSPHVRIQEPGSIVRSTTTAENQFEDLAPRIRRIGGKPEKHGGFAEIWKATLDEKQTVAVKCLRAIDTEQPVPGALQVQERLDKRMRRELLTWAPVSQHPRILPCIGFAKLEGLCALVSPWCDNGNMEEYLDKNGDEATRRMLVMQVAEGLAYLHGREHPIVHLDVKPPNVLIDDDGNARLMDFGVSKVTDEYRTGLTTSGKSPLTIRYSAPEALEGENRNVKSDVYSFGILMIEVLSRVPTWPNAKRDLDIIRAKSNGATPNPSEHPLIQTSDPLWDLLNRCWEVKPQARPTMQEVVNELKSLGFKSGVEESG